MAEKFDLAALLKDVSEPDTGREQIEYIPLELLDSDPNNFYQLTDIPLLADNISLCGLQQPIRVRKQENGRYMIVSGHRRRAALEMLVADGYENFKDAPCIVERDEIPSELQQLRLIFANSSTRKLSDAEIGKQAEQVRSLLYVLKEKGYEFPGRMRDHVAEAVGISKTKLARLDVIRKGLAFCWRTAWDSGKLGESVAYALAQAPAPWQELIYDKHSTKINMLYEGSVKEYISRFEKISAAKCGDRKDTVCRHQKTMMEKSCADRYQDPCRSACCWTCISLRTCKSACAAAQGKKKDLQETERKAIRDAKEAQARREAPTLEFILDVYRRIGFARDLRCVSVRDLLEAQGRIYSSSDDDKQIALETGDAKISTNTTLPFGYSFYASNAKPLVKVADLLDCSIDYLLGRSEDMRPVPGWQTGDPWNFGEYVVLVRYDAAKAPTPEKMSWTEDGWDMLGSAFTEICPDATIVGWMPMPEEVV